MDAHVFASLAHIRILLLPIGSIPQHTFESYAAEIQSFETIRLGDLPENKDEKARFMPKEALPTGHLHLTFTAHPPPASHLPLSLLRPSHFPLAVIGIATCTQTDSLPSILAHFNRTLLDTFPSDEIYPLARNCYVFEESADGGTDVNLGESPPGLVVIPGIMGNKKLYIGTLLADLCSNILGEFAVVYQTLESPIGNEYLNATLLPTLPSLSDMPTPLDSDRRDSLPPLPSHNSQPDMSKAGLTTPKFKRNSSLGPNVRHSTLGVQSTVKRRLSAIGAASSHGRLLKVLADFFLLAGRTEDASIWYTEAIQLFKPSLDAVWQASALEGLATVAVLDAWSAGYGLQSSTSAGKDPWTEVVDKLMQATNLYSKSPTSDTEHNYSLLSYLYCCCILRHTSLLFSVWSAKGWGPLSFATMLQPGTSPYLPPTLAHGEAGSWSHLERLSTISGVSRASISATVAQLHGPWLLHLGARERIGILEAVASVYSCLGYKRKEAYVLREVLGCILDLIVCGREEDGVVATTTGNGAVPGVNGLESTSISARGQVGMRISESKEGNESILKLLKHVCRVLGIDLDSVRLVDANADYVSTPTSQTTISDQDADDSLLTNYEESYGWPELQIGVVREAVAVAEALPDYLAVAQFSLSSLKTLQTVLAPADQFHLYATAARALTTARRRGEHRSAEYWSGRPVISITLSPLSLVRLPLEKPMSALQARASDHTLVTGGTDPFLYNPRRAVVGQDKSLVVQNEVLEFIIVLQNPFVFDLELELLSLSTSGIKFETHPSRLVIPALAYHNVTLSGKALETGNLVVRGCLVRAPGGVTREFILPLVSDEEEERFQRKRGSLQCETGRFKYSGLECSPWASASKRRTSQQIISSKGALHFLEYKVVPEQPMLRIRRTTITRGALMLYNGEISTIRVTVENVSHLPIDFIRLAFDDSTIAPAQSALAEGDLSVFETYETEYDLIHRPMFIWNQEETKDILPGQQLTLTIYCQGKVGCTNGTIHISYAYVHRKQENSPSVFHTRQLAYPLLVTVYHMLECQGMDVLPFPSYTPPDDRPVDNRTSNLFVGEDGGWCLFSVDVRNTYGTPFDVSIERIQKGVSARTSTTVPPGSTCRIVMPLKRFLLSEEQVSRAIPTLSDRQFVVNKSKLTKTEERLQRELFWYREELFKCLQCRWQETGGSRSGELSLRNQRMTLPMLETLRTETASIRMSLIQYEDPNSRDHAMPVPHRNGRSFPPPNDFLYLRIAITNLSLSALMFDLDVQLNPIEHVISEGILSNIPIGYLDPGSSREIETALVLLSYGRFEIVAVARALGQDGFEKGSGKGHLTAVVRSLT